MELSNIKSVQEETRCKVAHDKMVEVNDAFKQSVEAWLGTAGNLAWLEKCGPFSKRSQPL